MSFDRVIALIDMDCFYVQCEQRSAQEFWSLPCAVIQTNSSGKGGLTAVSYEARSYGLRRGMSEEEALSLCPDLHIFCVPLVNGKPDLSRPQEASREIFEVIEHFVSSLDPNIIVEKASIDEVFIDFTHYIKELMDNRSESVPEVETLIGTKLELDSENDLNKWLSELKDNELLFSNDIRLALGAIVVQQIRKEILDKTQFKSSAGISHNKMTAKLVCAVNKPNAQTILPQRGFEQLFRRTDIKDVRFLGGRHGSRLKEILKINTLFELNSIENKELEKVLDPNTVKCLKDIANGVDDEPVINSRTSESLDSDKDFDTKQSFLDFCDFFELQELQQIFDK